MYRLSAEEAAELEDRSMKRHKPAPKLKQDDLIPFYPETSEIVQVSPTSCEPNNALMRCLVRITRTRFPLCNITAEG